MKKLLKRSVLAVLCYHDIFDYPLTEKEILKFLPSNKNLSIKNCLKKLEKEKKIRKKEGFYFLFNKEKVVALRKKREKYSQQKIKIAQKIAQVLSFIPWIRMISITGALAMNNSDKKADIDFLIITAKDRLWLTRLIIILTLEILGKRPKLEKNDLKDKICPNLFLDETALKIPFKKQNLFTAHEIAQMKPIFNKNKTYEKFLKENQWIRKYLPQAIEPSVLKLKLKTKKSSRFNIFNPIFSFLEKLSYQFQLSYMKPKVTSESISPHFAFFHFQDTSKEVLEEYKKKVSFFLILGNSSQ